MRKDRKDSRLGGKAHADAFFVATLAHAPRARASSLGARTRAWPVRLRPHGVEAPAAGRRHSSFVSCFFLRLGNCRALGSGAPRHQESHVCVVLVTQAEAEPGCDCSGPLPEGSFSPFDRNPSPRSFDGLVPPISRCCSTSPAPSPCDAGESGVRPWHYAYVSRQPLWTQLARQQVPEWALTRSQASSSDID